MRIMRVNITVPDDIAAAAKAVGLNVSRVATAALVEELDRRRKIAALDDYLARLEADLGPIPADEAAEAARWADELVTVAPRSTAAGLRHLSEQRSDAGYRLRLAEGTGLPVLELPELVRRRFDLAALDELAGALAGAVSRNGRP